MKNKYMVRGVLLLLLGIGFNALGWMIRENRWGYYGWAMVIGTVLFGIGFLSFFYSLVRKVERQALLEERAAEAQKDEDKEF